MTFLGLGILGFVGFFVWFLFVCWGVGFFWFLLFCFGFFLVVC